MAGGQGQAHHIGTDPSGPFCHGLDEPHALGGENRQIRDHPREARQAPGVGGGGIALPDPSVQFLTGEAHDDARAPDGGLDGLGGQGAQGRCGDGEHLLSPS